MPNATQSFTLTVDQAPAITSANNTSFIVGTAGSFTAVATGYPTPTFSETGVLPSGVTFTSGGVLSGTPAAGTGGIYPFTITASNGISPNATQSFTLTVDQAPAITSASATTFTVGTAGSFTATATGYPATTFSETGTLPSGVTFSSGGVLSGTPAAGTGGVYAITITASNGVGSPATQSFTLTVDQASAITSANATTFTVGTAGTFTVMATGFPTPSLGESGTLPSGVTFIDNGNGTGTLSGTPAAATGGTYALTITANNGVSPIATQNFTLTVDQATTTTLASNCMTTFVGGLNQKFTITATVSGTNPAGTVTFSQGSTTLCSNVSLSSGNAPCTTSTLATSGSDTQDQYALTASYSGNGYYLSSASAPFYVTVLSALDVVFRNGFELENPETCPIE